MFVNFLFKDNLKTINRVLQIQSTTDTNSVITELLTQLQPLLYE